MIRDFAGIDLRAYGSFRDSVFEDIAETGLPSAEGLADAFAEYGVSVIRVDGGIQKRAAAGDSRAIDETGYVFFEPVYVVGNVIDAFGAKSYGCVPCVVEGFCGEFFLAFEVAVDAALFEAGCLHDGVERTPLVAALVE